MSKEQSHAPMKKLLLSKGPEPPTILRPNNFIAVAQREKQGLGAGCKKERWEW